jgi:hypothetical protein
MDSPLACLEGDYESAIFATYSINLQFFESWVRPMLARCGVRNVVVFADRSQLGPALAAPGLRSAGTRYHLVGASLGPGVFHPKIILLTSKDGARLCISSANLTAHGQLRNVESAVALDTSVEEHRGAIHEAGVFLSEVGRLTAPVYTQEAIAAALEFVPPATEGRVRFLHNLKNPLINEFPAGDCVAVAPFSDGLGTAAARIANAGSLTFVTDGREFAAPRAFFDRDIQVQAYDFDERRLHGKSYSYSTRWLLVGSPNLSEAALLRSASAGNTEAAIAFGPAAPELALPSQTPWNGDLVAEASARFALRLKHEEDGDEPQVGSFNAWWADDRLMVSGVAAASKVERRAAGAWIVIGQVSNGAVVVAPDASISLIRATDSFGHTAVARVHAPGQLRAYRSRRSGRIDTSLRQPPGEIGAVRELGDALEELLALDDLLGEQRRAQRDQQSGTGQNDSHDEVSQLGEWLPARPGDQPSVPELYRTAWTRPTDVLLALVGSLLPLDDEVLLTDDVALTDEVRDLDDDPDPDDPPPIGPIQPPPVDMPEGVVRRYRSTFLRLLDRASTRVRNGHDASLAALTFQVFLRFNYQLAGKLVVVKDHEELLLSDEKLGQLRLDLLEAYLGRGDLADDLTLAAAHVALAEAIEARSALDPARRIAIEALAYHYAGDDRSSRWLPQLCATAGLSADEVRERLRPFAERASWEGVERYAEGILRWASFENQPIWLAKGDGQIDPLDASQAWQVIGYAAVAGFSAGRLFGVAVTSDSDATAYGMHVLLSDPERRNLWEARRRRADDAWFVRRYSEAGEEVLALAHRRKFFAVEHLSRTMFALPDDHPGGSGPLGGLLTSIA